MNERDEMQTRAETAPTPAKIASMDAAQWAEHVRLHPGCTLPPGAATLIVAYFDEHIERLSRAYYRGEPLQSNSVPLVGVLYRKVL